MEVLDLCLECKACKSECPMSVDMATLKSEALYHRYAQRGTPLSARFFGNARKLNQVGSRFASLANAIGRSRVMRSIAERATGIDRRRPLPVIARQSLSHWFRSHTPTGTGSRGDVVFFGDSFSSFTEPEIGIASIELLEHAGWRMKLVDDVCCGRSQISKGLLDAARSRHAKLLDRLAPFAEAGVPIVGCEPSCVFTLKDELVSLSRGDPRAVAVARHSRLVDELLVEAIDSGSLPMPHAPSPKPVVFHGHCHQKAASALAPTVKLLERIAHVTVLDAGCCGMAGSFGFERDHYELSMQIGEMRLVRSAPDASIAATGVSCRQQIAHGTGRKAEHPVVLLHRAAFEIPR
jgi:Fe-S oxidoreductase